MKNRTVKELKSSRPDLHLVHTVEHCLNRLYRDRKHGIEDEVAKGLTYEELIGCLLQARDMAFAQIRKQLNGE